MKIIRKISVSFVVVDSLNKDPIENAVIYCNGNIGGYLNKGNGYFIYTNMQDGVYNFTVMAQGFQTKNFSVNISSQETSPTVICVMNFTTKHNTASTMDRFLLRPLIKGLPIVNGNISVIQDTKISKLRVVKTTELDSDELFLSSQLDTRLMYQEYVYGTNYKNSLYLQNYNKEKECYITKEKFQSKIKIGTLIRPKWILPTDEHGVLILPVNNILRGSESIMEFTFSSNEYSRKMKFDLKESKSIITFDLDKKVK